MKGFESTFKKAFSSYKEDKPLLVTADFKTLLKNIKEHKADLVLTDPPYSISKETGFKQLGKNSIERFAVSMNFGKWDCKEIDLKTFAKLSFKALRTGGTIICFYDLWKITKVQDAFIQAGFGMIRLIIWEKTNPVPLNSKSIYLSNSREVAVLGVKGGKPTFNSKYDNGVYNIPIHREKRIHPTQKPLKLMEALIDKHTKTNDLVVDPFLGSGSTALASHKLKRRFIGGDKDLFYVEKARNRFEETYQKKLIFRTGKARQNRPIKKSISKRV
ncbi:MAG: site-specific DNA-methyltransferase [Bdellovibrionales bacterium]|nr:site-specific DNA-methyltransferase [Bdellovibrionales bacterium]